MLFDEAVAYLLSLGHETLAIKLGLKNIQLLLNSLDNPQQSFFSVQIAGTNGKGSTATFLDSICSAAGIKTGLYTSPHLISITERIKICGQAISKTEFANCVTHVRQACEDLVMRNQIQTLPSFFEQVTGAALLAFRRTGVEIAILETGLGGRLDATTAADAQIVALTQIALDHQEYLGQTIKEIAAEKAAIIRPGVVAFCGPQVPEALATIESVARAQGVTVSINEVETNVETDSSDGRFCVSFKTPLRAYKNVWLGLRGRHQIANAALAVRLAEAVADKGFSVSEAAITQGLTDATHEGRLELIAGTPLILLDGAHNPAAAIALREYLETFGSDWLTLVFGAMRDKNLREMAEQLFTLADRLILTRADNPRSAKVEELAQVAESLVPREIISIAQSASEALTIARQATPASGLICVTGSLYLLGEVRALLPLPTTQN